MNSLINENNTNKHEWTENLLHPLLFNDILGLQELLLDNTLEAGELAERVEKMKRLSTLKKEYPVEKIKNRPDGRCYIYINRKQFIAPTYDLLIEKLYNEFYGVQNYSLADIFPQWQLFRRDVEQVSSNTLKDHMGYWNNYMKDSTLVKLPITQITPRKIKDFYQSVVTKNSISEGTFKFIKTILNKLFDFAISELEIIQFNPIPSVSIKPYKNCFKESRDTFEDVYKTADREKILRYLQEYDNDIYSLATQLAFRLIIRIGELKALKWTDIDGDYVYIRHQTVERQVMNDDLSFESRTMETVNRMKGKQQNGKRKQFLTAEAKAILQKIKQLNPNGEYILMKDEKQLSTCTYNRHLKRFCEDAGIEYHSSQKIRFTSASILYDGTNLALLSNLLGHTTTTMTLHYFRNILGDDEIKNLMSKLDQNIEEVA